MAWPDQGLRLAAGFRVTEYASETLAEDIYAMTLDAKGRVVVTSRGYIKTLEDTDADGRADQAKLFAQTETGGMGLCFDGTTLYFVGDGFFSRYRDRNGDGVADGPPEKLLRLQFGEHGGHAVRKGPDGWWYIIGGNDAGIGRGHATATNSPITWPEAGALLRVSPDGTSSAVIADGFRNPYDFDFNASGDIFAYDSDAEADFFLPWYTPTRLYHVLYGNHHGWRLNGWQRSWNRPAYYADSVEILASLGRGSPTGVVCYRHRAFPERYRDGLFVCDWTFGRVYFAPLQGAGSSYQTAPEIFLEPLGTQGFAPSDIAVAPDGALIIAMGGRKTRGAVYRIEPVKAEYASTNPVSELSFVLQSAQPLDGWSRARWEPLAKRLGMLPFSQVAINEGADISQRVRAIEILTEMFHGLPEITARKAAASVAAQVRARVAWSLGRAPYRQCGGLLLALAGDPDPMVRCAALNAAFDQANQIMVKPFAAVLLANFGSPERRGRQAAERAATALPAAAWKALWTNVPNESLQTQLTAAFAAISRNEVEQLGDIQAITAAGLRARENPGLLLEALRLTELLLGDYRLNDPTVEVYTGYEPANPSLLTPEIRTNWLAAIHAIFPSADWRVNLEASRILAMLEDAAPETISKVANQFTLKSSATTDFHYLAVLSRLRGPWPEELPEKVAGVILGLDTKLAGQESRPKQNWTLRLVEVLANLLEGRPRLAATILSHPQFVAPSHLEFARAFNASHLESIARLYLAAVRASDRFPWSAGLVRLLSALPAGEVRPLLRLHWDNLELREAILEELSRDPEMADRSRLVMGLGSSNPGTVANCLQALMKLPADSTAGTILPLVRLLHRLSLGTEGSPLFTQALLLFNRQTGQNIMATLGAGRKTPLEIVGAAEKWFNQAHPGMLKASEEARGSGGDAWRRWLTAGKLENGDPGRGKGIFEARGCQVCHSGASALGPDLAGVAKRLGAGELLRSIADPNAEVAPLYRATLIQTADGRVYRGMIAFESADGVILQSGPAVTVRLPQSDIVSRRLTEESLMPAELLNDLSESDLADLLSYLRSLGAPEPAERERLKAEG